MVDKRSLETQMGDQRLAEIYDTAVPAGKRLIESVMGTQPIAIGGEKIVYEYKDGQVVAFLPPSEGLGPEYVKRLKHFYYAARLGHILLPNNIPDAHVVGSQPPMMVLDTIEGEYISTQHEEIINLQDIAEEMGIHLDSNFDNYIMNEHGNLQFVDSIQISDYGKLDEAVKKLPEASRPTAERYFLRLDPNITGAHISYQDP